MKIYVDADACPVTRIVERLAEEYENGRVEALTLEKYAEILKNCISVLREEIVVHRITGDGAKKDLIAPLWSADKKKTLNFLNKYLKA